MKVSIIGIAVDTRKWVVPMWVEPEKFSRMTIAAAEKRHSKTEIAETPSQVTSKTSKHITDNTRAVGGKLHAQEYALNC
jgi:hypothetical protein